MAEVKVTKEAALNQLNEIKTLYNAVCLLTKEADIHIMQHRNYTTRALKMELQRITAGCEQLLAMLENFPVEAFDEE